MSNNETQFMTANTGRLPIWLFLITALFLNYGCSSGGGSTVATLANSTAITPLSISTPSITLAPNASYTFTAAGGKAPYYYSYSGVGTLSQTIPGFYTAPSTGPGSAQIIVMDSAGSTPVTATVTISTTSPGGSSLSISPSTATVAEGQTIQFSATGGTPPYNYFIIPSGPGTIVQTTGIYTAPLSGAGTTVQIQVTDSGGSTPSNATLTITATTTPSGTPLGCYTDSSVRALPNELITSGATVETCIAAAQAAGFAYAGVQYGDQCFAGDSVGYTQVSNSLCNIPCTANSAETCGGYWLNSIYTTGIKPSGGRGPGPRGPPINN